MLKFPYIALKFGQCLGSTAVVVAAKFQSDSKFKCRPDQQDLLSDIETLAWATFNIWVTRTSTDLSLICLDEPTFVQEIGVGVIGIVSRGGNGQIGRVAVQKCEESQSEAFALAL